MRLAIRDDDTSYYTRPRELEEVYAPLGSGVPVSLAVTPFAVQSFHLGDPERFYQSGSPQALASNPELTAYLREGIGTGRFSVMCHGYTHAYQRKRDGQLVQECVWKDDARLGREAALGRSHLEEVLAAPVRSFVPPGNSIRLSAMRAVGRTFPRLLTTVPARRWREFLRFPRAAGLLARRLVSEWRLSGPSPRAEQFEGVWLLPSLSLTANSRWEDLITRFSVCQTLGADLIVAVHYWELRGAVRDLFCRFFDHALRNGAELAHCDDLFPDAGTFPCEP
jgi:hypothetical protein